MLIAICISIIDRLERVKSVKQCFDALVYEFIAYIWKQNTSFIITVSKTGMLERCNINTSHILQCSLFISFMKYSSNSNNRMVYCHPPFYLKVLEVNLSIIFQYHLITIFDYVSAYMIFKYKDQFFIFQIILKIENQSLVYSNTSAWIHYETKIYCETKLKETREVFSFFLYCSQFVN